MGQQVNATGLLGGYRGIVVCEVTSWKSGRRQSCKLSEAVCRSNLPKSIQISSAVIDVTDNDYFYRTRIFWGQNYVGERTTFWGVWEAGLIATMMC